MTSLGWFLLGMAAQLLQGDEREAVLGDLVEASEGAWQGLLDVLSLVLRRQAILLKSWQPWLAAFGLTVPGSFLLMGTSVSVSQMFLQMTGHNVLDSGGLKTFHGLVYLLCEVFLLLACSWAGGFVTALVSRRSLWVSAALCGLACLFCLASFRIQSLSRISLLLFLVPAILGVRRGLGITRIKLISAIILALGITILMVPMLRGGGSRLLSWALVWPAWYLVGAARESGNEAEPT